MTNGQYPTTITDLSSNDDGTRDGPPRALVIHTYEDGGGWSAESMADFQSGRLPSQRTGSYHVVIAGDGRSCRENDDEYIPWAAGWQGNRAGLHVSLSGRAAWDRDTWLQREAQLTELSRWLAHCAGQYGIPLDMLSPGALRGGGKGVAGHFTCTQAWPGSTDHTDPGEGRFPFDVVIERARGMQGGTGSAEYVVKPGDTLTRIAARYRTTARTLAAINNIPDPNKIRVGQVIRTA